MSQFTIPIKIDTGNTESEIKSIEGLFNDFFKVAHTPIVINADITPVAQAIKEAFQSIPKAAQKATEDTNNELSKMIKEIGQIGLSIGAIVVAFNKVSSSVRGFINIANEGEKATTNLTTSLKMQGESTETNIKAYQDFALEMQNLTNVSNQHALQLLTLSVNYGISNNRRTEAVKGAIGLAKAFEGAGLSQETALKGIAMAYQGEWSQLQRYIPALRDAQTETEKLTILQQAMAQGFQIAKDETNTGAGAMQSFANSIEQSKLHIGDMINSVLTPFVTVLTQIVKVLNENPPLLKAVTAGVTTLVVAYTALKIKIMAAKVAQDMFNTSTKANPYIFGGAIILSVLTGIVSLLSKGKKEIEDTIEVVEELKVKSTMPLFNPSEEVKSIIQSLKVEAELTQEAVEKMFTDIEASRQNNYKEIRDKWYDFYKSNQITTEVRAEINEMNKFYDDLVEKTKAKVKKDSDMLSLSEYKNAYDLSQKRRALGLITQDELIAQANRYFNHVSRLTDKDSAEYLEALAIKENAHKGLIDSEVKAIEQSFMSKEQLTRAEHENQIARFRELLQLQRITQTQHDEFVINAKKKLETDLLSLERDSYMERLQFAETQKQLGILNFEDLLHITDEYYIWVCDNYNKDTNEYIEALNMKRTAYQQYIDEQEALNKDLWNYLNETILNTNPFKTQLDTQLELLKEYYHKANRTMSEAQWKQMNMEKKFEEARNKLKRDSFLQEVDAHANALGNMGSNLMRFGGVSFAVGKALMKAQAIMQIPSAAFSAYESTVKIPYVGHVLAPIAAAAAVAVGMANLQAINNAQPPKYKKGGLLKGASHSSGGILIEAEGNEYITNKNRVAQIGTGFFDFINFAPINQVRQALSNFPVPPIFNTPVPSPIMATGGYVQAGFTNNDNNINSSLLQDIITGIKDLKSAIENKKMTVNNHFSCNDILRNADPETVHEIANYGKQKKGGF